MKIKCLFVAAVCCFCLLSCSNEDLEKTVPEIPTPIAPISKMSSMLRFKDLNELEETVIRLVKSDEEQQKNWAYSLNFTSQKMVYNQALDELEKLQKLTDYATFSKEYKKFRSKYSPYFLFNENKEDEDLSPYIPSDRVGFWMVCDVKGNVMVGDSVWNFNELKSLEETSYYKSIHSPQTHGVEEKENYLYIKEGKRKMWAGAVRDLRMVCIRYSAHKKSMFGWNKYRTKYFTAYISHDPNTWISHDQFLTDLIAKAPDYLESKEMDSGAEVFFGNTLYDISSGTVLQKGVAQLRIKSRGTGDTSGILKINM